jgi:peptide deformylase
MAKREILVLPDQRLRQVADEIPEVDASVKQLAADMLETMYAAPGIGLAAPQVGEMKRIVVMDLSKDGEKPDPIVMINPEIKKYSDETVTTEEGCLSIPEIFGDVTRPERVVIEALDQEGQRYRREAIGLKARAIQHEIDHLDGILFLDHLSLIKRQMLLARWRREHKDDTSFTKEVSAASARPE